MTQTMGTDPVSGSPSAVLTYNLGNTNGLPSQPYEYELQYSPDLLNWTTLTNANGAPWSPQVTTNSVNYYVTTNAVSAHPIPGQTNELEVPSIFFRFVLPNPPLYRTPAPTNGGGIYTNIPENFIINEGNYSTNGAGGDTGPPSLPE